MSLTANTAPFGSRPAGVFNFDRPRSEGVIYFEDFPRRIRGSFAGETVVDSRRAKLLHEQGLLPILYFPEDEVRMDLLEPSDHRTRCPWKGDASHWSLRVGGRVSENAAWSYPEPLPEAPPLAGYLAFYWDRVDEWLEEDEPLIGHVRDPYHRVDVLDSSRHVRVELDGVVLAETSHPRALFETSLPTRWYIPPDDVRRELLVPSERQSVCAYKGVASYHSVTAGADGLATDLVWFYPEPREDVGRIRDYLCFFDERVDVFVDGELQERPLSPWSR
jgi:uncharacterized protein (DUF427 family)